jgi:hypothetical protein
MSDKISFENAFVSVARGKESKQLQKHKFNFRKPVQTSCSRCTNVLDSRDTLF